MKKKIVILSAFLSPLRSGAEACSEEVPLALKDEYDFVILTARMRKDLPQNDLLQGHIPVRRLGLGCTFDKWLFPFLASLEVRKHKPDSIHAILETFAGLGLMFCKWTSNAHRILTCQTTNRSFLKGPIVRSADTVTVISRALQQIVAGHGKEAHLIPNGIHLHALLEASKSIQKEPNTILFVGRIEPMKGIDTLLQALYKLKAKSYQLHICGEGSQRQTLEQLSKDLGIDNRVTFHGAVAPNEIANHYAKASIFCGLSRSEAFGNVFREAQAALCAVVGTTVGGIPDSVDHGVTGLLVCPDDAGAAAEALTTLLEDEAQRTKLAEAGQKASMQSDWSEIAKKYGEAYSSF